MSKSMAWTGEEWPDGGAANDEPATMAMNRGSSRFMVESGSCGQVLKLESAGTPPMIG
jgi:hypothetical protein